MAKKSPKKSPKQFVTEVATDPAKLGKFILDPEGSLDEEKFTKEERSQIKHALGHHVCKKLADALYVTSWFVH